MDRERVTHWGIPIDASQLSKDVSRLLGFVELNKPHRFNHTMRGFTTSHLARIFSYMATIIVGIQKANDPVSQGLQMDLMDRETLRYACTRQSGTDDALAAHLYGLIESVASGEHRSVTQFFDIRRDGQGWKQAVEILWTAGKVLQWMRDGSNIHSIFAVRAAILRLMLATALKYVKQHEWSEADLATATDLVTLLDDSNMKPPGDNWL